MVVRSAVLFLAANRGREAFTDAYSRGARPSRRTVVRKPSTAAYNHKAHVPPGDRQVLPPVPRPAGVFSPLPGDREIPPSVPPRAAIRS